MIYYKFVIYYIFVPVVNYKIGDSIESYYDQKHSSYLIKVIRKKKDILSSQQKPNSQRSPLFGTRRSIEKDTNISDIIRGTANTIKVLGEDLHLKNRERIAEEVLSDSLDLQEINPVIEEILGDDLPRLDDPGLSKIDFFPRGRDLIKDDMNLGDFYKIVNPKPSYLNNLG